MTKEEQQAAIVKACNVRVEIDRQYREKWYWPSGKVTEGPATDDLNAMHEAEGFLTHYQRVDFMEWLGMCDEDYGPKMWAYVHATAAQRAEAFLKTLNLWEDSTQNQKPNHD